MFDFFGSSKDAPGIGDLMNILGALTNPKGNKAEAFKKIVEKYATDEHIDTVTSGIINGLATLQDKNNIRYVLYTESIPDKSDIIVKILYRDPVTMTPSEGRSLYLSQITREDILSIINLFLNGNNSNTIGDTKQLHAGADTGRNIGQ